MENSNDPVVSSTPITPPPVTQTPPSVNQPTSDTPTQQGSKNKLFVIIGCAVLIGIIILSITFMMLFSKPKNTNTTKNETTVTKSKTKDVKTYPKFQFTYETPTTFPQAPSMLMTYQVKDSFTDSDISSFGAQFGFEKPDNKKGELIYYADFKNPSSRGYLTLDTNTGGFDYQNMAQNNKLDSTDFKQGALNFLKKIGLQDDLINCDITYNLSTLPDITYVECHRSWEKLGAPLLNLPGVLNIPMTKQLSSLQLGFNDTPLTNPAIINVSTGQNGVNRPNDFNTATFAISPDGTILSVTSNMRWITAKNEEDILTPNQAFELLKQNKIEETVAIPAGTRNFEWDKVFPTEGVTGQDADINGFEIVYVENELSQKQKAYTPTYIFRGNVTTNTGYSINFVQTVSAAGKNTQSISESTPKNNLQLQTFQLSPTLTRAPTTKATISPLPTGATYDCSIDSNISAGGIKGWVEPIVKFSVNINGASVQLASLESAPNTFYINQKLAQTSEVQKYKMEVYSLIAEQLVWNYKNGNTPNSPELPDDMPSGYGQDPVAYSATKGIYDSLMKNPNVVLNPQLPGLVSTTALSLSPNLAGNPCYLTGLSPTLFIYSESPSVFKVRPSFTINTDPILTNSIWTIKADGNGLLSLTDFTKEFLYYEFNPSKVTFSEQEKGFVLSLEDIKPFAPKLAKEMKLNTLETERLLFELEHAINDLPANTEHVKISLVPSSELNKKLPLTVSPKPEHTNRYHFLLSKVDKNTKTTRPTIPPVKRGTSTLIEIGASTLK